jgi:hypothetical protein
MDPGQSDLVYRHERQIGVLGLVARRKRQMSGLELYERRIPDHFLPSVEAGYFTSASEVQGDHRIIRLTDRERVRMRVRARRRLRGRGSVPSVGRRLIRRGPAFLPVVGLRLTAAR